MWIFMRKLKIKMPNKEILQLYYATNHKYINVSTIRKLFGCSYQKAAAIRNEIQAEMTQEGKKFPEGYVPFDRVLDKADITILTIERNYQKQIKLGI